MRILIAEDDQLLADGLSMVLQDNGYTIDIAPTGTDADAALMGGMYDLLILDLGLPNLNGLEILKRLREREQLLPVLILTARDRLEDRVLGLDLGANDYITKPFELPELEARIRALLRKSLWANRTEISFGSLKFNTVSRIATADNQILDLSARELAILEILLQRAGQMVSKDHITDLVSSWDLEVTGNAIVIAIHRLRKKLEEHGITIRASRGLGYHLETSN